MTNCPLVSVVVPLVVPITITLAPTIGLPSVSQTVPVIRCCAKAASEHARHIKSKQILFISILS